MGAMFEFLKKNIPTAVEKTQVRKSSTVKGKNFFFYLIFLDMKKNGKSSVLSITPLFRFK